MTLYKALTIWQPWATLIALEFKQYETRHWPTKYRGTLLIHAAKRPLGKTEKSFLERVAKHFPEIAAQLPPIEEYPLGAILCQCQLEDCISNDDLPPISEQEKLFGFYGKGRYAWKLSNAQTFYVPNVGGSQGIWTHNTDHKRLEVKRYAIY